MKHCKKFIALLILIYHAITAMANDIAWHNMLIDNLTIPVYAVFKDNRGLIWVGTNRGLYTYDGHTFRKVKIQEDMSITEAHYNAIVEHGNKIYFGTNNGLFVYDLTDFNLNIVTEGLPTEIRCIKFVGNTLWIGSLYGLYTMDVSNKIIKKHDKMSQAIYAMIETKNGSILLGTYDGLFKLDPQTYNCEEIELPKLNSSNHIFVNSILEDKIHDCIWIGTEGSLLKFQQKTGEIDQKEELEGSSIKNLCIANNTDLLVGTDNGLFVIKPNGEVEVYRHDSRKETSIANNVVWTIFHEENRIWLGTEYGLSMYDDSDGLITIRLEDITGRNDGNQIFSLLKDHKGSMWIGGTNGLIHWKNYPARDYISDWYTSDNADRHITHNHVRNIHETQTGQIWVATDGGINRYDDSKGILINYKVYDQEQKYNVNWAYALDDEDDGKMWIGAYMGGIMAINLSDIPKHNAIVTAEITITQENGLPNNLVGQLEIDSYGNKWIMLFRDRSIFRIDKSTNRIHSVDILTLVGKYPESILFDKERKLLWCGYDGGIIAIDEHLQPIDSIEFGDKNSINKILAMAMIGPQMWISSNSGIWIIETNNHILTGLPFINEPITSICYDEDSRRVLMGSIDNILSLNPSIINNNNLPSTLAIMSVVINDSIVSKDTTVHSGDKFEIENNHSKVSIELSGMNYNPNCSFRYSYRIDNNEEWVKLKEGDYKVVLTNLDRGKHKVDFSIGDCNVPLASLNLHVSGPWYTSTIAYFLYAILATLIVLYIIWSIRKKAETKTEEEDRRRSVLAVQNRINFLSNISHDLKTPLSLIVGPISKLLEDCNDPMMKKKLTQIYENAIKLNSMVHKAIEINRIDDKDKSLMILSSINVVEFCKNIFDCYKENHPDRNFLFTSSVNVIIVDIDVVKMESVLNNLLSNACKYSADNSTISCLVSYEDGILVIIVSDDGLGIPTDEQSLIFQRLFRSNRTANLHEGTGIGLYLVKQYVEMHGGTIEVTSKENEGSTFTIKIPCNAYDRQDKTEDINSKAGSGDPKILIVEDNNSISEFIKEIFSKHYQCVTATNGRAALSLISTYNPDIIITDEMMPIMSGLEMCAKLKEIPYMSHIPIIMLTAKDDNITETESAKLGVNIFMSKPFNATLLSERVKQLLEQKKESVKLARRELLTEPKEKQIDSQPERLLAKITEIIEQNISDPKLNVSYLCGLIGISQQQVYRITKKLVDQSPVEYIRQIRLRQAAMLLRQRKFTVSEVMYMVGFSSASYFSKCFYNTYGMTPSQYQTDN